jgi:hypothetical protein
MNITPCPAPFDRYGYDANGKLWKRSPRKYWIALAPRGFYLACGIYYVIVIRGVQYCFYSHTKIFKEVKK